MGKSVGSRRGRSLYHATARILVGIVLTLIGGPATLGPSAAADILRLTNGGSVEGEILESNQQVYKVRTVVGMVTLPAEAVAGVERTPSPFAQYATRARDAANTTDDQFELAKWCGERGLSGERRQHLLRVVQLDPNHAPAREALGYVRVGSLWVEGRTAAPREAARGPAAVARTVTEAQAEDQRLASAIQGQWRRQIRAVRRALLESPRTQQVFSGREKILAIDDPLAILPLVQELGRGSRGSRLVLVEALSRFSQDEATLNLAVLALVDGDESVRDRTLSELRKREDPRIVPQYRRALLSDDDELIRRAAVALGRLQATEAIPDLIKVLTAQRRKLVEVPIRRYWSGMAAPFQSTTVQIGGGANVVIRPQIGLGESVTSGDGRVVRVMGRAGRGFVPAAHTKLERRNVTVYRTEVLESLKLITGRNFGFEPDQWQRWYEEQKQ